MEDEDSQVNSHNEVHRPLELNSPDPLLSDHTDQLDLPNNNSLLQLPDGATNNSQQSQIDKPQIETTKVSRDLSRLKDHNKPGLAEETFFGTETEAARFESAKLDEIKKWRDMETFE